MTASNDEALKQLQDKADLLYVRGRVSEPDAAWRNLLLTFLDRVAGAMADLEEVKEWKQMKEAEDEKRTNAAKEREANRKEVHNLVYRDKTIGEVLQ